MQEEQLYADCRARLKHMIYLSKLLCICPSLFETNLNKARYSIYGNPLPVFSTEGSLLEEKYSHANSSTSTDPFSAAMKTLVLGNLFKLVRFATRDNEKNKTIVIFSSSLSPSSKLPVRIRCQV